MRAGLMDRRIVIERPVVTRHTGIGSEVVTWSPLATAWAQKMESSTGTERLLAGASVAARPTKFRCRFVPGVSTDMRVNENGRLWQIIGTAEMGRRAHLEIACQEFTHE